MANKEKSVLTVVFTTVFMDLVGFGIIIPLLPLYGQDLGANEWSLPLLVAAYSLAQFFFSPLWGQVSDRHGRRPVMLVSMGGSTLSYLGFALATYYHSLPLLMATRFLQGTFAANISAAQACIADVTPPQKRAGGMALIGISFGLGFILGPIIGGVSLKYWGVLAPGLIAGGLCGLNLLAAWVRLPETLAPEIQASNRAQHWRSYDPLNTASLRQAFQHSYLWLLLAISFLQLAAFSTMEQVFALFFKARLHFSLEDAGLKTGYALAFVGFVAAAMQGGFTRRLAPRIGERRMLIAGLFLFAVVLFIMPFGTSYASYFMILAPLAVGRSLIDPSMSSLISQAVSANEQGRAFGTFQGLNSLARVVGPALGIWLFERDINLPFFAGGALSVLVLGMSVYLLMKTKNLSGVDALTPKP
ncbi:MAG TPA: MFS transporter [bacterium]|nr:MFS transporter [bacterium]